MAVCRKLPRKIIDKKKTSKTDVDSIYYQLNDLLRKQDQKLTKGWGARLRLKASRDPGQALPRRLLPRERRQTPRLLLWRRRTVGSGDPARGPNSAREGARASRPDWQCIPAARAQSLLSSSQPRPGGWGGRDAARLAGLQLPEGPRFQRPGTFLIRRPPALTALRRRRGPGPAA